MDLGIMEDVEGDHLDIYEGDEDKQIKIKERP